MYIYVYIYISTTRLYRQIEVYQDSPCVPTCIILTSNQGSQTFHSLESLQ